MANLLNAIKNIVENPIIQVRDYYSGKNRANSVGDALENYVKDVFANTFEMSEIQRLKKINEVFSYLGNQNNPPDVMLRGGDAIETKKIQSPKNALALNSSYPKTKIFANNPMLADHCRNCEDWTVKDVLYVIGHTDDNDIKYLWMVYGDCFVADKEVYERVKNAISEGIYTIPDVEFTKTNELGKVKRVDPLGVTDLRIRGMWHIDNPHSIFTYLDCFDSSAKFQLICLMKNEKFDSFPVQDKNDVLKISTPNFKVADVEFKNPNNPAKLIEGKLITFKIY
jgi:NgoPII restriction endonuclease